MGSQHRRPESVPAVEAERAASAPRRRQHRRRRYLRRSPADRTNRLAHRDRRSALSTTPRGCPLPGQSRSALRNAGHHPQLEHDPGLRTCWATRWGDRGDRRRRAAAAVTARNVRLRSADSPSPLTLSGVLRGGSIRPLLRGPQRIWVECRPVSTTQAPRRCGVWRRAPTTARRGSGWLQDGDRSRARYRMPAGQLLASC